jgi:threonine/homoserine efflux transporter RhtA
VSAEEKAQSDHNRRYFIASVAMTMAGVALALDLFDKTGPHHGEIRLALAALAFVGSVMVWISVLQGTTTDPKG